MKAMPLVLGEIATLGLLEVIVRAVPDEPTATPGRWRRLAVACGADEVVVGVFNDVDDFVVLPDDGRPRAPAQPAVR
jgi:hypothetical protein